MDGGYQLTIKKSTGLHRPIRKIQAEKLILAGGVIGTVKLLLKCREKGSMGDISSCLGDIVRTNSEAILGIKMKKYPNEDFTKGVSISAGFYPDNNTHVETVRYGEGQNLMALLTTFLPDRNIPLPNIIPSLLAISTTSPLWNFPNIAKTPAGNKLDPLLSAK